MIHNNEVIGCGGFCLKDNMVRLVDGMITKTHHKTGAGAFLLASRLEKIKFKYPKLKVGINTSQHTAGFFERYGFVMTKKVKNFYALGIDKVSMEYVPS
ncbi:GNAT family N-acetyltransferase [Shewanella electrodiphila]|uniref:GNAT family N-acetyltransferase n=1 Tax=Shewanella electrodiphila TaxID=934143 RepID=A0ABT0KPW9_9GAMM|nr:GNAT family N-acetyltransferase [Shewanella electrodiphila]